MAKWRVLNVKTGVELGVFEGDTGRDALDTMARAAGFDRYSQIDGPHELRVERVIEPPQAEPKREEGPTSPSADPSSGRNEPTLLN